MGPGTATLATGANPATVAVVLSMIPTVPVVKAIAVVSRTNTSDVEPGVRNPGGLAKLKSMAVVGRARLFGATSPAADVKVPAVLPVVRKPTSGIMEVG